MPIVPNIIERLLLLRMNKGPGLFLDIFGAGAFQAVRVALKLGVFESLSGGPLTAAGVAREINANERGTRILLEGLESFGYLKKLDDQYSNSSLTVKWLLASSSTNLADIIDLGENHILEFSRMYLEESIRRGKPPMTIYEWFDQKPGSWRVFQLYSAAVARMVGDELLTKLKIPKDARRLIDVGGGHGLYSIMFCRQNPLLSASVFDLPQALTMTDELISVEKMSGRVSLKPGNFWIDDLGDNYDVALMFNILHAYSPEKNIELLRKVSRSMNSHGLIVVMEQLADKTVSQLAKVGTRFFGLAYLAALGGQTRTFDEVSEWLLKSGFSNPRRINFRRTPGNSLVLATKAN